MLASPFVANATLGIAVLVLFAALWVVARGAGRVSLLRSDLIVLTTQFEALDTRITREVKTRAGLTRAAETVGEKDLNAEAASILAQQPTVTPFPARPKRPRRSF